MSHLALAPVLLPALAAVVLLLFQPSLRLQRGVSIGISLGLAAIAVQLLLDADSGVRLVYALGNWRPPFGIVLVVDRLAALMLLLAAILGLSAVTAAAGAGDDRGGGYFHPLFLLQLMGLNGAFLTGDLFNLFVFFEVLLVASYCLLLHGSTDSRVRAALHYVAINLVGSALFLIGVALLYALTGTLNLADLAVKVRTVPEADRVLLRSAALLLLVVFGLKAAQFPLFLWLSPTYSAAAAPVAALFAIMTKVGIYAILRVYPLVFGPAAAAGTLDIKSWLLPAALLTTACGAMIALASRTLSGLAAHLTLMSAGTIVAIAALGRVEAHSAALFYLAHSTCAGALLFLVAGLVGAQRGEAADRLLRRPAFARGQLTGMLFLLAGVAVTGLPPLSGFLAKAMLLQASAGSAAMPWIWATILGSSLLAVIALVRGGVTLFWSTRQALPSAAPPVASQIAGPALLLLCVIGLTVAAEPVKRFADATAAQLAQPNAYIDSVLRQEGRP